MKEYLQHIVDEEMPRGLKHYPDLKLMPWIQMNVGRGVSLEMAWRWLHHEGFRFTEHKKELYFDGHEHSNVVDYQQNKFLPAVTAIQHQLIEFEVGNVEKEAVKPNANYVERQLVLFYQDESMMQANDSQKKSWIMQGEQPLQKKDVDHGIHHLDVICSTVGWLKDASQTIEYEKNYNGYWNGEMFVEQVDITFRCVLSLLKSFCSFRKKLFQHLRLFMNLAIKHWLLSTTLRDMVLLQKMHYLSHR